MKIKNYLFLLLAIFIFTGCTNKTAYTNRSQLILMSTSQEMALGEQSYKETLQKAEVITNSKDAIRIKTIGNRIAKVINRSDYKWEFNLIKKDEANAFCLPGGKVAVYTGILKYAQNDDQLATVMSHEIAHALARHGAERVTTGMIAQGIQVLGNIAINSQAPQYSQAFNIAYGLGSQYGVMLPYGRLQENEADEIGIILMYEAGYNPNEAVKFWENMSRNKNEGLEFLSTHPSSSTRISNIKRVIRNLKR